MLYTYTQARNGYYVVIHKESGRVHSAWKQRLDASNVAYDLNRFTPNYAK